MTMITMERTTHELAGEALRDMGAKPSLRGYHHAKDAIEILAENPLAKMMTKVYGPISKTHDTTPSRVERSIRHMIEGVWQYGDTLRLKEIFGSRYARDDQPNNSEFLSTISEYIKILGMTR